MLTILGSFLSPFLPYIVAAIAAVIGGGGFLWNAKRQAKKEGIKQANDEAKAIQDRRTAEAQKVSDNIGADIAKDGLRKDDGAKLP